MIVAANNARVESGFTVAAVSFFAAMYIASVIVFRQNYNQVTYVVDGLFALSYVFLLLVKRERTFWFDKTVLSYLLFALLALVSSLWAVDFDGASEKGMQLFLILINMVILYDTMSKYHSVQKAFMLGVLLGAFVNYLLLMNIVNAPFEIYDQGRAMGTTGNANLLGLVMVLSIVASIIYLYKEKTTNVFFTYYLYANMFFAIYMIMLTVSKKGILFGAGIIIVYLLLSIKDPKSLIRMLTIGFLAIIAFLYFVDVASIIDSFVKVMARFDAFQTELQGLDRQGSTAERLRLIYFGLEHFTEAPILGHGVDNYRNYYPNGQYAHNNFIEVLFDLGLIGIVMFYAMYFIVIRSVFKIKDIHLKIIILIVLINAVMIDMARVSYDDKLTIYLLAFFSVLAEQNSRKSESSVA